MIRLPFAVSLLFVGLATVSALPACETDSSSAPTPIEGTMTLEVLDEANLVLRLPAASADGLVTFTPTGDYGLLAPGEALQAPLAVEAFPEANMTLYTARLASPARSGGPCGSEPVSLALSLQRQAANDMVIGGLTAYCGAGQWQGIPVRVLRLAGTLPLTANIGASQ